jgi:GTPase SAR1 family protein
MTSVIRTLLNKIYPTGDDPRVTMLGLGASGKTTILYLLKLHSIITTIPSIGFNVETVSVASSGGKHLDATVWDIGTGCGIKYLYGFLNLYVSNSNALIWVVDASERGEWLQESVDALARVILNMDTSDSTEDDTRAKANADIPIMM